MTRETRKSERLRAGALPDPSGVHNIVEQAGDMAVYVADDGEVAGISVNPDCPSLGCLDHWVGRPFEKFLTVESKEKLELRLAEMRANPDATTRGLELNHIDNATWEFPIRYTLHRVYDGGLLLLGRDMQPIAEVQQRLVAEQTARERDQQRLRGEQTFYHVVLEASETPLILVEPEKGRIRDLNSAAAMLLGTNVDTLSGSSLAQAFDGRRREELMDAMRSAAGSREARGIELVARRNERELKLYPDFFRAAGELYMLCRVRPADGDAGTAAESAQVLGALYAATSDAIVITDGKGAIRDANEAFLTMADAAQLRDVRDNNLADFLVRGAVDTKLMLETAAKQGRLSNYATQMASIVGTRSSVDVSVARLRDPAGDFGYGFILRNTSLNEGADAEVTSVVSEEAMKNVMDLVGTASLKELVSATSDVIEKLCIETAVQLTGNNRVAAAEMLGLSRQSLYVKLRKYGLINSGADE
ncbi:transcriptional regulator [Roseovarius atlanticus]|uniref:Transcriptional regulator n=1 Tax=Roseovarius atlanticus TaxID=1641875 RepID=A0A0T5NSF2_9RHOB|nr:transcriptional regulator PpsR [Roseovarius atlanticus]KRS11712.1 transcriptional regulator [Roseovarius atlanticus]